MTMVKRNKIEYDELARAEITNSRAIVISSCSKGGFTIAQQLQAKEEDKTTFVFMKGAFHVEDVNGLYNIRDAVNAAIHAIEDSDNSKEETWDE